MIQPRALGRIPDTPRAGFLWAADNDCFQGFHQPRYETMLRQCTDVPGCLFITCPDVVADADATRLLFARWHDRVAAVGPVALVAQDGLTSDVTPWKDIAAIFIGGSTEWKLSEEARLICKEAKERGKWLHKYSV